MKKKVIITGIFGQDGSYLCEKLFDKNFEIFGIPKKNQSRYSKKNYILLKKKKIKIKILNLDLKNYENLEKIIKKIKPNIIFHLAAQHTSSEKKDLSDLEVFLNNYLPTLNFLTAIEKYSKKTRFIYAGSCLIFDNSNKFPQTEKTFCNPISAYGISKMISANTNKCV